MKEESLIERLLYRLVKKHIAGTTMSSALSKAQELNRRNLLASVSYLSGNVESRSKARYITTTYMELIRRISRLGLRANVQIPLEQIGYSIDREMSAQNLAELLKAGNRHGVFVWAELNGSDSDLLKRFKGSKGLGIAVPEEHSRALVERWHTRATKVVFDDRGERDLKNGLMKSVEYIARNTDTTVLASPPEKLLRNLLNGSRYKKSLVFEFRLGYSERKIRRAVRRGARVSINLPFGKDWTTYAMRNVPEGYMRFLAGKLLKEGAEGRLDVKKE